MNETQVSEFLASLPPKPAAVTTPGEFRVGVIGLDHGHIGGMCSGLRAAGAGIVLVYDRDTKKAEDFAAKIENNGNPIEICYERNGEERVTTLVPLFSQKEAKYKIRVV